MNVQISSDDGLWIFFLFKIKIKLRIITVTNTTQIFNVYHSSVLLIRFFCSNYSFWYKQCTIERSKLYDQISWTIKLFRKYPFFWTDNLFSTNPKYCVQLYVETHMFQFSEQLNYSENMLIFWTNNLFRNKTYLIFRTVYLFRIYCAYFSNG